MQITDLDQKDYFEPTEIITDVICAKTQNYNKHYFRFIIDYQLNKVASMMRANIVTLDRGKLPINMYLIALAASGFSKGHSLNIIEETVINQFREIFMDYTLEAISDKELAKLANSRATRKGTEEEQELESVQREYNSTGNFLFNFKSGSSPAYEQLRHKLLMCKAGSLNFEMDEIARNLINSSELLTAFLESFDTGKLETKLIKNTKDQKRFTPIRDGVPSNLLMFGTPTNLFDGGKIEKEFDILLESGYARRCFFSYADLTLFNNKLTALEIFKASTDTAMKDSLNILSTKLKHLADIRNFSKDIIVSKEISIKSIEYQQWCKSRSEELGEHETIRKVELNHRYFKTLKLSGTYAFIDGSDKVTDYHWYAAVKRAEDSGKSFEKILIREKLYIRLAKFLCSTKETAITHVDIIEELPFYKTTETARRDMLTMAIAWGYKNNHIIKSYFENGIEFIKGETLIKTNLTKMIFSLSQYDLAKDFIPKEGSFNKLFQLGSVNGMHWCNHHFIENYRQETNALPKFNLLVLDVDDDTTLNTVKLLLKEFTYLIYTTKRHTKEKNRFRIIFPLSHILSFTSEDYTEFMGNIYEWLPFKVDTATGQRSRKWLTHKGNYFYNEGLLFDVLPFIPKTTKNEERIKKLLNSTSLNKIERWFLNKTSLGNRSNQLIKYALMLVDSGQAIETIQNNVLSLNSKLINKLSETEVLSTIMVSVSKAITKREINDK